jgi:hypothetical protein
MGRIIDACAAIWDLCKIQRHWRESRLPETHMVTRPDVTIASHRITQFDTEINVYSRF